MYDMYPDYAKLNQEPASSFTERSSGGLGHYDYPVTERRPSSADTQSRLRSFAGSSVTAGGQVEVVPVAAE